MFNLAQSISELTGSYTEAAKQAIVAEGPSIVPRLLEYRFRLYTDIQPQAEDDPEDNALMDNINSKIAIDDIILSFGASAIPYIHACVEQLRTSGEQHLQYLSAGGDRLATDPDDPNVYSFRRDHSSMTLCLLFTKYCNELVKKIKNENSPTSKFVRRFRSWVSRS